MSEPLTSHLSMLVACFSTVIAFSLVSMSNPDKGQVSSFSIRTLLWLFVPLRLMKASLHAPTALLKVSGVGFCSIVMIATGVLALKRNGQINL